MIPEEIKEELMDWADDPKIQTDGYILEEMLTEIFEKYQEKAPEVPEEDLWVIAKDKLYEIEIRDILRSKAEMFVQMFIGVSQLQNRNRWRKTEAERAKREDFAEAVDKSFVNEDGRPLREDGRILQPWWSRIYLGFSTKKDDYDADPESPTFNFFIGSVSGKVAENFGKPKPKSKKMRDHFLRPKIGHWYNVRWTYQKDEYPLEIEQDDGEKLQLRSLGRSAKITNFATEMNLSKRGLEAVKEIAESFPEDLIIPIPKKELAEWFATHVVVDTDEEGKEIKDWNAFGLIKGKLMEIVQGTTFASITLMDPSTKEEIRIVMDPYTLKQVIDGVGTGSIIGAFAMPYLRKPENQPSRYEARGLGLAVLSLVPPLDLDEEEGAEEESEDFIEEIEEI